MFDFQNVPLRIVLEGQGKGKPSLPITGKNKSKSDSVSLDVVLPRMDMELMIFIRYQMKYVFLKIQNTLRTITTKLNSMTISSM